MSTYLLCPNGCGEFYHFPCWTEHLAARPYHWLPPRALVNAPSGGDLGLEVNGRAAAELPHLRRCGPATTSWP